MRLEYIINNSHKCWWCISQSKWHDLTFEKTKFDLEGCLPHIC